MCYRHFTILSRAPNSVSNEHSCLDRIFGGQNCSLDTGGGGGVWFLVLRRSARGDGNFVDMLCWAEHKGNSARTEAQRVTK